MLNSLQQSLREIEAAKRILVVTPGTSIDAHATSAALVSIFEKLGKQAVAISHEAVPPQLAFLPETQSIKTNPTIANDFVVTFDVSKMGVESLSYKMENNKLHVYITPKTDGDFTDKDVTLKKTRVGFDLIIVVNAEELTGLGEIFSKNPQIFYNATVLNLDHNPANEGFGKINYVDIHAASTTQILFNMVTELTKKHGPILDKNLATLLLTGIISETQSFQTYSVTPEVLEVASELFRAGGNQQEIVRHLFRTKELGTLNLWGKILANLKQDEANKLAWSCVAQEDFQSMHGTEEDIVGALKELLSSIPGLELAYILYESQGAVQGKVYAPRNIDALSLVSSLPRAHGDFEMASFTLSEMELAEAETFVSKHIQEKISLR